jgi:hypothetical protein
MHMNIISWLSSATYSGCMPKGRIAGGVRFIPCVSESLFNGVTSLVLLIFAS